MKKKGQLTLFIIIGILLLLAIGIAFYAYRERLAKPIEEERVRAITVPTEVQPLQEFIQTCMHTVAREGLHILGERGGYIATQQFRFNPYEPTQGNAVQFAPDSELKVPYWWHMNARNDCVGDCTFASEQPPLRRAEGPKSIEGQLDAYLEEHLPDCFRDFTAFREQQFTLTPTGPLKPETRIALKNVVVLLDYPLEATRGNDRFALKEYVTELPVNIGEIYVLATNITNLQAQHTFLERATRNLIDVFGRTDETALPPVTEMEFGFAGGTIWTKFDVEQKIKDLLTSYIPLLRVTFTRNYRYFLAPSGTDTEFYEVLYNRAFTVPVLKPNRNLAVRFAYLPWWKPYFDLNCNGQICQPEGFSSTLGFLFGVRRYTFAYDVSYPVLVEIKNPDAFGGEGYTFKFFLEANMRNNQPLAVLEPPLEAVELGEHSSLLCDPLQRTGGNVTINVRTSQGQPVDDAELLYKCGTETCSIGRSVNGKLVTQFPRCIGGFLTASHVAYSPAVKPLDVLDASPQTLDVILGVGYPVDFAVKKWLLMKRNGNWELDTSEPVNQGPRETAIIMLNKKGETFEEPVMAVGEVCGAPFAKAAVPCGTPPSDTSKDAIVYSGDYHVTIYSFLYPVPDLVIPPDRRKISRGSFRRSKHIWVPPNPIVFNTQKPLFSGFAEFDWRVSEEELMGTNTIEFSYINFALDKVQPAENRKIEDLQVMGNLFSYSEQFKQLLRPKIT